MKPLTRNARRVIAACIVAAAVGYSCFYFNYFETPTGDYISNIRGPVLEYMKGNFPGTNYKFLPLYPGLLALLTPLNPIACDDPVYLTALAVNILLFVPYILLVLLMYRRFLPERTALAALAFLGVNGYTVYMSTNAELEMLLALLIILSLHLTLKDSLLAYLPAFLTGLTKWDSVFVVPAVMFRDFFIGRRRLLALVLGSLASVGVAAWLLLSLVNTPGHTHPYVSEIAHRGPNIYRFPADALMVASGFVQWMAMHGWFSDHPWLRAALLAAAVIPGIATIAGVAWGAVMIARERGKEFAPVLILFAGFFIIHMIYQNTKDRYALPILWILNLFLFQGLAGGVYPWLKKRSAALPARARSALTAAIIALSGALYAITLGSVAVGLTPLHVVFAAIFTGLFAAVVLAGRGRPAAGSALIVLLCGIAVNCAVFYGARTLDHHGMSRVEFKNVALWYREHAAPDDRMLISETNVPKYYSGFGDDKFIISYLIRGATLDEIVRELASMKATHVFVDDFYIRRLRYRDPNAIDRKAWVFREIRDRGEATGHFRLIKTFTARGGITSYLYRFIP